MKPTERGIAHLLLAARYSWQGLRSAWRYEESFRQEALVIVVSVPLAMWLARDIVDFLLLTLPVLLTLAAELGNSAIEAVVDRIGEEHHELSGRAKDFGSAMVFMNILVAAVSWSCICLSIFCFD
ncbi:MAG: diacylglycerol kinase [Gammaproteobacteria bacterium]|nr:diacylglycerol kinase [Gammaproteobacteria bacterium]